MPAGPRDPISPSSVDLDPPTSRLLLLGLILACVLVWTGLRTAQALFPNIPVGITIDTSLATIWAALVVLALGRESFRHRALHWIGAYSRWLGLNSTDALLLTLAPLLSMSAWSAAGLQREVLFPGMTALLWAASLFAVLKAGFSGHAAEREGISWTKLEAGYLVCVTLGAFLARAIVLDGVPWLLTGDEGSMGLSAVEFLQGRWNSPFNIAWFSFPSLYFTLPAASMRFLGNTMLGLRLPSAIAGALTVFALYVFARRTFGRTPAVISSAFLAAFHFHVHFSRLGLNNVWDGLFYVILAASLWRAWRSKSSSQFIWPGVALGFSFYFYATARMLPAIVLLWLLAAYFLDPEAARQRGPGLLVMALAALAIALPLVMFFIHFPREFMAPMSRVGSFLSWLQGETAASGRPVALLALNQVRLSGLAFFSVDLRAWYMPEVPMLLPLSSALFALGSIILITRLRDLRNLFIGLWLLAGVLAGAVSESTPAAQRYVQMAPAVALVLSFPLAEVLGLVSSSWPGRRRLFHWMVAAVVAALMANNLIFYFADFSREQKFGDINTETANRVAQYLRDWPAGSHAYFLGGRMGYYTHSTVPYLAPQIRGHDVLEAIDNPFEIPPIGPTTYIVLPERQEELPSIESAFPGGVESVFRGRGNETLFYSYAIRQ